MLILAIIAAALFAVACDAPTSPMPWVTGGVEFDPGDVVTMQAMSYFPKCPQDEEFEAKIPTPTLVATVSYFFSHNFLLFHFLSIPFPFLSNIYIFFLPFFSFFYRLPWIFI